MKYRPLFWISVLVLAVLVPSLDIQANKPGEPNLTLTIHCPKDEIKQGDEIPIVFTITNKGKSSYRYYDTDNFGHGIRSRLAEYRLVAKRENGTVVPDPQEKLRGTYGYGGFPKQQIEHGESFTKTVALNQWALVKEPGRYRVTAIYYAAHLKAPPEDRQAEDASIACRPPQESPYSTGIGVNGRFIDGVPRTAIRSAPIEITVKLRTDKEMGDYIRELSNKLKAIKTPSTWRTKWEKREELIRKLMYTCDRRIVPMLIDSMYQQRGGPWAEVEAFEYYLPRDREIKNMILETVKNRGLVKPMLFVLRNFRCTPDEFKQIIPLSLASENLHIQSTAAEAARLYPDDEYTPRLITIATDPSNRARYQAIYALAYNRTDEGVKTLKALLESPDAGIRNTVSWAVRNAYTDIPVCSESPDNEYTSELIAVTKDTNNFGWEFAFAISEIARTRTEEGIKALKALLEDPEKDIPIAKSDEGVKKLKALLNSPDRDIRERTAGAIYWAYQAYPGRPLREDDFGEEFKESFEDRKKRALEGLRNK